MFLPQRVKKVVVLCTILLVFFFLNYFHLLGTISVWKDYTQVKSWRQLDDSEEINLLAQKRSNMPVKFWYAHKNFRMKLNDSCAEFPDIMKVNHVHDNWQLMETEAGEVVKIFGAYLDDRLEGNQVRLLTMINKQKPIKFQSWCQFWFHDKRKPVIVPVVEYQFLWHEYWYQKPDGEFQPFLLSCPLPSELSYAVPSSVSLVENFCDKARNSLKVVYNKPKKKKDFAVCTKGLNFGEDITVRLVEWIELLILLGVEKIYMFDIYVNPHVQKLYDYYTEKGILEVEPLMLPQVNVNEPYLQHMFLAHDANMQAEVIPYNHCFLSHMYEYNYIAILDTDEVIMPKKDLRTWKDLVQAASERAKAENVLPGSFIARNCYFFDNSTLSNVKRAFSNDIYEGYEANLAGFDIPEYMHMTQRMFRSKKCTDPGMYIKSIHNTEAVVSVHNHYHFEVLDPKWISFDLDLQEEGFMHHYRNGCPGELSSICYQDFQKDFVFDDSVLQYYNELKANVIKVLDDLGYYA